MKRSILTFLLVIYFIQSSLAQCDTYIQMVYGLEGCLYPRIVSTQQLLLPCAASSAYYQLAEGEFAYISYVNSSCITMCMSGTPVDITCVNLVTGTDKYLNENKISIYPNPTTQTLNIDGLTNSFRIEVYDVCGSIVSEKRLYAQPLDISKLSRGLYFLKLFTKDGILVRKFVKK